MSNHRFNWSDFSYSLRKQYTALRQGTVLETPQNRIFINTRGGRMKTLRSAPVGAYANAQIKRERAGGRACDWIEGYK